MLDAGTTDSGRPYFAMELVKGVPITKYCDDKHLPLRERLELFVHICQAVQHAHQKGIIHRDIKPNNVLVAEYDNHAVPKVIDFGVAKATAQRLTERTMFTEFGQVLGTIEYMSPEQAKLNQLDIDTGAIGYYGVSWGASAVQAVAVEDRIKAAVLVDGGLEAYTFERRERDPVHYLPRITIPVLMLNGRFDAGNPPKEAQEPMFRMLGTDPTRKRYKLTDSSHVAAPTAERIQETVNWFDQYLGPVTRK